MISLKSKLQKIGKSYTDALGGIAYHYFRPEATFPVLIWQEDGEGTSFYADHSKGEQSIHGTTDYYTRTEYDANIDIIQDVLENTCETWQLLSVQYEDETKLIHYEWEWEVVRVGS